MKLYTGKIGSIAQEVIQSMSQAQDIEVNDAHEAQLDVEAVLKEYVRMDRECTDKAKDLMEERNLPYGQFGKLKRSIAEEKGFALGEEGINWMANQILETFMQSQHVDEVFADDVILRRKIKDICKKHMQLDEAIDQEVRDRIKNLEEGSSAWDVEYAKVLDQIKQKHGVKE